MQVVFVQISAKITTSIYPAEGKVENTTGKK